MVSIHHHTHVQLISVGLPQTQWRHCFAFCFFFLSFLCVATEDGNFQNFVCGNLLVIFMSALEKHNLCM